MKSKYSKKVLKEICLLIAHDDFTIAEICLKVGISERSYYLWRDNITEFAEAIDNANDKRKKFFVSEAKKSLLKKIQGYTVTETHTVYASSVEVGEDGKRKSVPKIKEKKIIEKTFQPDSTLIMFALTNHDPDNFKNRQTTDSNVKMDSGVTILLPGAEPINFDNIDKKPVQNDLE